MKELVPFEDQLVAAEYLAKHRKAILGDPPGSGKTLTALLAMRAVRANKLMIFARSAGFDVWREHCKIIFPDYSIRIVEKLTDPLWPEEREIVLSTWAQLSRSNEEDLTGTPYLICDEFHEYIRSRKTAAFKALCKIKTRYLFLISGTPIPSKPENIWPALHICDKWEFPSYWNWVNKHFIVIKDIYGMSIEGLKSPKAFGVHLQYHMIARRNLKGMPSKLRSIITVEMNPQQQQLYSKLFSEWMLILSQENIVCANELALRTRLRQFLCCPHIINESGKEIPWGVLTALFDKIRELGDRKFVIFVPYVKAIAYIVAALNLLFKKERPIVTLHGSLSSEAVKEAIDSFKALDNAIAVCSIPFSQSFSLSSARYALFIGLDWIPYLNIQAEDRLARRDIGEKETVFYYYFVNKGTIEEDIINNLNFKHGTIEDIMTIVAGPKIVLEKS